MKAPISFEQFTKNPVAAIAFAAFASQPNDILVVTPSDHVIEGQQSYHKAIDEAIEKAKGMK